MKFRTKLVAVEAIRFDGSADGVREIAAVFGVDGWHPETNEIYIRTLRGTVVASSGDWIIKGARGEFYSCPPDLFEATYEAVE